MPEIEPRNQQIPTERVQHQSQPTINSDMTDMPVELPYVEKVIEEIPIRKHSNVAGAILLALGLFMVISGLVIWNSNPDDPSGLGKLLGAFAIAPGLALLLLSLITAMFAGKAAAQAHKERVLLTVLPIEGLKYQLKKTSKTALIYLALTFVAIASTYATGLLPETSSAINSLLTMAGVLAAFFCFMISGKYFFKAIKISWRIRASSF